MFWSFWIIWFIKSCINSILFYGWIFNLLFISIIIFSSKLIVFFGFLWSFLIIILEPLFYIWSRNFTALIVCSRSKFSVREKSCSDELIYSFNLWKSGTLIFLIFSLESFDGKLMLFWVSGIRMLLSLLWVCGVWKSWDLYWWLFSPNVFLAW